ncbi:hypothetical protein PF005_g3672 [Phytophthora fragariae]|uniref:Uncharacterized protein n=1 Tax=Phytophthora fragariae TaxID=53985 RepID=A0A6A3SIN7_9STRA|nr:hypothetical protein PF003_g3510 [Phytophthora fragariae]KAE8938117.1 hypothetical protein PF009_g11992 [Phytophthora fragariae]KAE9010810.1 hypothetical protein PF011_g9665 [Phytophthora fragariae]KAE9112749.1 hypothetical protein PF007_g10994 [Phytophthora fragariae]KAE9113028.1 hypothetical protein PF010_g10228 [Phytophthora fragariae]
MIFFISFLVHGGACIVTPCSGVFSQYRSRVDIIFCSFIGSAAGTDPAARSSHCQSKT